MAKYQTITLTLADGRRVQATARAFCEVYQIESLAVVDIEVSPPADLPAGYAFEVIHVKSGIKNT